MEKLNIQDYNLLLELIKNEKDLIHEKAIHDKELREREIDLDFIAIKLNTLIKLER